MDGTLRDADIGLLKRPPLLLQGVVVLLVSWTIFWSVLHHIRAPLTLNGSITRVLSGNAFAFGPNFHLQLTRPNGQRLDLYRLPGGCQQTGQWGRSCAKPEFPPGAQIEIDIESAVDFNRCSDFGRRRTGLQCALSAIDHISQIRVNGQPVQSGWSNRYNVPLLYLLIACAVGVMAFNRWRLKDVSWISIVVFLVLMSGYMSVA